MGKEISRRDFLKLAAAGVGLLTLSGIPNIKIEGQENSSSNVLELQSINGHESTRGYSKKY